jgi:hypothetical protein
MTDVFESVAIVTGTPDAAGLHAAVYRQLVPRQGRRRIGFTPVGAVGGNTAILLRGQKAELPAGAREISVAADQEYAAPRRSSSEVCGGGNPAMLRLSRSWMIWRGKGSSNGRTSLQDKAA